MQLKKGVDVLSSAGEKIGSLDRVVLDPQSNEVTHIIGEYAKPRFVVAQDVIPDDTVALEEGARVISSDGKQVGNVEEVIVGTSDYRVTHFVISKGLFLKERKLVPTLWVSDVDSDQVTLSVEANLVEQLPEYESES